jgi:two-component system sensor histidine kinase/response regulator
MLAQAEAELVLPQKGSRSENPPANILLVDDRVENLLALQAILEPLDQNLVQARSGVEALRCLLQDEFAVILMDVQMPGMDGFETVNVIKSRDKCRHIPIIFITALSKDNKYVYRGYSAGAVDYIGKPFNPEILRSKVGVFVELFKKEKEIQRQADLINEGIRKEAERRQTEMQREMEQKHLRDLAAQLEARVTERTKELVETNRDLEAFCYSIAHDLRTPIREISATSNILLADAGEKLSPEELDNLKAQSAAAKRMGQLIDDLLRLSRLGRKGISRRKVDLSKLAREIGERMAAHCQGANCELHVDDRVYASADAGLVEILLQNLFENAYKYSPDGGKICFGAKDQNGQSVYFMADEGIGFDMRYERKLFLPFERLVPEGRFPGTGIGLAMVQKIVAKHGGKVWAEGEPEKGATFYFTLEPQPGA